MSPGVGIVFVPELEPLLHAEPDLADFVEIEPQTLWRKTSDPELPYRVQGEALARLRELPQTKLIHGVGFPVGGSRVPDPRHLQLIGRFVRELDAPWWSEHMAFNEAERTSRQSGERELYQAGFLLPPLPTRAGARTAIRTIRSIRSRVLRPFAFETGVNYLRPRAGEMSDGEFTRAVAEGADCAILLDLHNLWANERNGRQSIDDFLDTIPLERVIEVHVAGGMEYEGYWLDSHSGPVAEELLEKTAEVLPRLPQAKAVVFEMLPEFYDRVGEDEVRATLHRLREVASSSTRKSAAARGTQSRRKPHAPTPMPEAMALRPEDWEDALGGLVIGDTGASELAAELALDPGIAVLRHLVWYGRAGRITEGLSLTIRLLGLTLGREGTRRLLSEHFADTAPALFATEEALAFADFLTARGPRVPWLTEVLAFERATLEVTVRDEPVTVLMRFPPEALLRPIANGRLPNGLVEGRYEVEIDPESPNPDPRSCSEPNKESSGPAEVGGALHEALTLP